MCPFTRVIHSPHQLPLHLKIGLNICAILIFAHILQNKIRKQSHYFASGNINPRKTPGLVDQVRFCLGKLDMGLPIVPFAWDTVALALNAQNPREPRWSATLQWLMPQARCDGVQSTLLEPESLPLNFYTTRKRV
jgi:hypothetical protein